MVKEVMDITRICHRASGPTIRKYEHQKPWPVLMAAGLIVILTIYTSYWATPLIGSEPDYWFDIMLLDVDQDGNLLRTTTYGTSIPSTIGFGSKWGRITELTTGGFAIAGFHVGEGEHLNDKKLWVIRTDENYNPVWGRTYERTFEIRSIMEMNNGDLAIGHYIKEYDDWKGKGEFQILIIDNDGEYVREENWHFGWLNGFLHCSDGGFMFAKEIYNTPTSSPFWITRIDSDLSTIWKKYYPCFAGDTDIVEDMAGGFTMSFCPELDDAVGIVRLDNQGDEILRVATDSTERPIEFWLTQCSNGEYLGWSDGYIIRFNIEGEIQWEKYVDYYVHGIKELSPNRFVAFERADLREIGLRNSGMDLECFNESGTTIWTRSVRADGFFVPDVIRNTDGALTILGMLAPNYLSSVLDGFSKTDTETACCLAASQFLHSLFCSDTRFSQSVRVFRIEAQRIARRGFML